MTFYWGYDATILFPWWGTSTALDFYLSCFCIFGLCLGSAKVKAICRDMQHGEARSEAPVPPVTREACSEDSVATASGGSSEINGLPRVMTPSSDRWPTAPPLLQPGGLQSLPNLQPGAWTRVPASRSEGESWRCLRAKPLAVWALLCIAVAIDWGMMLVCMTFNAGLFCAVVVGVATGQLLTERRATRGADCCSGTVHS